MLFNTQHIEYPKEFYQHIVSEHARNNDSMDVDEWFFYFGSLLITVISKFCNWKKFV